LDELKATELPGTTGAIGTTFSPDGRWIGFYAGNKFNKVSVEGGAVVPLADVPGFPGGANWAEDDTITVAGIASTGPGAGGLARIRSSGGTPIKVTDANGELGHVFPQTLPGGKAVLFGAYPGLVPDKHSVDVVTLADGHRKTIVPGGASARYVQTSTGSGHLLYAKQGTLFAIPFDPDRLETRGAPVPIVTDLAYQYISDATQYDVSLNGTLVYCKATGSPTLPMATIQWLTPSSDGAARKEQLRQKSGVYASPHLSPDGTRLAMLVADQGVPDVWVYDIRRDAMTRLTVGGGPYTHMESGQSLHLFLFIDGHHVMDSFRRRRSTTAVESIKGLSSPNVSHARRQAIGVFPGRPGLDNATPRDQREAESRKPRPFRQGRVQHSVPVILSRWQVDGLQFECDGQPGSLRSGFS
jgi:serine/threonine-protein kinase